VIRERAYLDHNASSAIRPQVLEAMTAALGVAGNASSVHHEGRQARAMVEASREEVASLVGVTPAQIVFTSGGTEANVMALSPAWLGGAEAARLFVSAIEHPSVLKGGRFAPKNVERLPVDADGVLDIEASATHLRRWREASDVPFMASLMLANNETGAVQPVEAFASVVHALGGALHCDCVQAAGKISLEAAVRSADLLTVSAHKFGGPKGAGALVLCNERLGFAQPLISGGGQERGYRAGTENVAAITGFGVAAGFARQEGLASGEIAGLRDQIEAEILRIATEAVIFAREAPRLPNTVCFACPGMSAETLLMAFDLDGVALSAGSACSSGKIEHSHVLAAMGAAPELAGAAIRVSAGWNSTGQDVERFGAAWQRIYSRFQERRRAA
jgi:cysteine desulfurase